ncbi:hypothetical protein BHF71_04310 [Vulcanibacillus modesticaldus]|uniref:Nucleosidase n=1 Tax=Vulcanibacillus modesticaldus TaxID=337097 RepID=A0A1D2YRX3_9BACI|nr:HAD family hydrolase [Vulcanibacillus modesticaldus]OEF96381.1 hypothetical protein BHF71_04310 [Vulcanibacillus modesticaldus]
MGNKYDAIIFDFDGTLFQTEKLALPSFERTFDQLKKDGIKIVKIPSEQQMLNVIGMTLDDIWNSLLPELPKEAHIKANEYMLKNELDLVNEGYGALYPGVIKTLDELKRQGYRLFIASNGLAEYVKGLSKAFMIESYFDAIYTAGEYNTSTKKLLVKQLIADFSINKCVMVGDRHSDIEAGEYNHCLTVGCDFGFASIDELDGANVTIKNFVDLLSIIDN